jgi:ketosteroid isomerase-like protein
MHINRIATLAASAALCACVHHVDVPAERKALLAADAQFATDTAAGGAEAWASWFAEDGVMYPVGQPPVQGRNRIRELMSDLRDPRSGRGDLIIEWEPVTA